MGTKESIPTKIKENFWLVAADMDISGQYIL
jgi:hypothetical protein